MDKLYFDIRSEKLFRESEDAFYYFADAKSALRYLDLALELSPASLKLLLFKGDILLCEGFLEEALDCFLSAKDIAPKSSKVLAGLANCYEFLGENELALKYVEKALSGLKFAMDKLFKPLYELKTSILIRLGRFEEAKTTLDKARFNMFSNDLEDLRAFKLPFIKDRSAFHTRAARLNLRLV